MKAVKGGNVSRLLKDVEIPEMFFARQTFPRESIAPADIPTAVRTRLARTTAARAWTPISRARPRPSSPTAA